MKRCTRKTLGVLASVALLGACAVVLVGKDDIRRFLRMRRM